MSQHRPKRLGLTLMELMVVLAILVALTALVIPFISSSSEEAQKTTTQATLKALREAVLAYYQDMKGVQVGTGTIPGTTGLPEKLIDLQLKPRDAANNLVADYDPVSRRGWRGPYLMQATGIFDLANLDASFGPYGLQDEIAFLDGWGNPIILQWPTTADPLEVRAKSVRLISAGPPTKTSGSKLRGVIDTLATTLMPTRDQRGNDLLMFLRTQDQYP